MKKIETSDYTIYFGKENYEKLANFVREKNYSKLFIIADTNTNEHCVPYFLQHFPFETEIIEIEAGEEHKNIETCVSVWEVLSELGADRKSLIINIGGGAVTDLGGFVASTFMRGIDFVNIPTTLLAMVDASVGGKTGVDLGFLKNQIGVINQPKCLLIDIELLSTLPKRDFRSGLAEMFKHGLIGSLIYWSKMANLSQFTTDDLEDLIFQSIQIKRQIVEQDPLEKGLRKTLNYGHTIGHAIESYRLATSTEKLLHGEAVAIGLILETFLSEKLLGLPSQVTTEVKSVLLNYFPKQSFSLEDIQQVIKLLLFDKKNTYGQINFVLLKAVGIAHLDIQCPEELIYEAFDFYQS